MNAYAMLPILFDDAALGFAFNDSGELVRGKRGLFVAVQRLRAKVLEDAYAEADARPALQPATEPEPVTPPKPKRRTKKAAK